MTDKEILKKAIEKAEKNGFNFSMIESILIDYKFQDIEKGSRFFYVGNGNVEEGVMIYELLFNHSFAKTFFYDCPVVRIKFDYYLYHLQQMVIESEPLKYIERFL